jgi:hypothetical protein
MLRRINKEFLLFRREVAPVYKRLCWSVRLLVRPLVGPHITSKTDYVAIPLRLGFGVTSLFSTTFLNKT